MERAQVVEGLIGYFKGDHWRRLMAAETMDSDPQNTHIHAYVETCVHPGDLEQLICGYLQSRGVPSARRIDYLAPRPRVLGSLHGIEPQGKAHFDWNWFYNPEVALAGTTGGEKGESGCNLLVWNKAYVEEFYADYPFRTELSTTEERVLRDYFRSDHWQKGLDLVIPPRSNHGHFNIHTSVHPDLIKKYALEALDTVGWKVYYVCPNVFLVSGKYTGKLVFMGQEPEAVYDIGWLFKPDVIIEPAWEEWNWNSYVAPGYDLCPEEHLQEIMSKPYVKLSDAELQKVLDAIVPTPATA